MIFISYRISDALDLVAALDRELTREFGVAAVFRDKSRLEGGQDWTEVLEKNAKTRRVMLVVIGPTWQTVIGTDERWKGIPRLLNPDDWVRKELTFALDSGSVVIPVLLNGAPMPSRDWLMHCGLDRLASLQAHPLRSTDYESDLGRLLELVRKHCPELAPVPAHPSPSTAAPPHPSGKWTQAVLYPLQPAPHFAGRGTLLKELSAWALSPTDAVRVVTLVAAGGTGKTALTERVLVGLPNENPFGVFVWSFYENPQTEAFLRAACEYFLGEAPKETGGLIERLQHGLRADCRPHLLILDGLELVQATGATGRPRGALEDPLMRRFLRWLAAGRGTRAKALITSRFPLPDLEDWHEQGFRPIELEDLDAPAARFVLRRRGVKGTDAELAALADGVHGHALTVDVLGLYLSRFGGGDPRAAAEFDLRSFAKHQKGERLSKVLTNYAEKLPDDERDLLARLSLFPRGVTVEYLEFVAGEGPEVAGALAGCDQLRLLDMLVGLRELGLVFLSEGKEGRNYSAHPFLRDFFVTLLGATSPQHVHEAVRKNVAAGLGERPSHFATDPDDMDRYERLIELTRLAGDPATAYALYHSTLGGFRWLGEVLGDNARGVRILSAFCPGGDPARASEVELDLEDWGRFALSLGDLRTAEILIRRYASESHLDWVELEIIAGRWAGAADYVGCNDGVGMRDEALMAGLHYRLLLLRGDPQGAADALRVAQAANDSYEIAFLGSFPEQVLEADLGLARADFRGVNPWLLPDRSPESFTRQGAICAVLRGRCLVARRDYRSARDQLAFARGYVAASGNVEITLRSYHLAAEIARHERNFPLAESEALDGIQLADSCGFGRWSLDIRTELAKIHLAADEPAKAVEPAEWVLRRSQESDCQYGWGIADSLHLLGVAHARLGNKSKAREYLQLAVEERKPLEHPELPQTESELVALSAS